MSKHDVIVIGSGMGGMTAALTAARAGRDVAVLEAGKQFGGFSNPFSRRGFWFDPGIHYVGELGPDGALRRELDALGLGDAVSFREINPEGFDRYVFPDYEVRMCRGLDAYRARLEHDFPHQARHLRRFFDLVARVREMTDAAAAWGKGRSAFTLLRCLPVLMRYRKQTAQQILEATVTDPRLRAVLAAPCGDLGLPPSRLSGLALLLLLGHYSRGAYFPIGGSRRWRDAYVDALREHGATLRRNTRVDRILVEGGRAVGVVTDRGDEYRASTVISNASAADTLGALVDPQWLPKRTMRRLATLRYSVGSFIVFIGTDASPEAHGLDDANIWHYDGYDLDAIYAASTDPEARSRVADPGAFFMTLPTLKDPDGHQAPPGKHCVELITFTPAEPFAPWRDQPTLKRDAEYRALKRNLATRLIAKAERYLPNLAAHMEVVELATPLTNVSFVGTPRGSIYGLEHTPEQTGPGRMSPATPIPGLYLCGADVLGAGIFPCFLSGRLAAKVALARVPKPKWLTATRASLAPARGEG